MRGVIATVLVGVLVLTAGCSALEANDDREPFRVDEELDPQPVAGVEDGDVTSSLSLHQEHHEGLDAVAYQETRVSTFENESGALVEEWTETRTVSEGGAPAFITTTIEGPGVDDRHEYPIREEWRDGERATRKLVTESGQTTYANGTETTVDPTMPIPLYDVYLVVDTVDRIDGGYRLAGTADAYDSRANVSVDVRLTDEGIVQSYHVRGQYPDETAYRNFTHSVQIDVGEGEPEEPGWLEEAGMQNG